MSRLSGKVAVVTGGALGIGRATSLRLTQEGASVLIADVNTEEAAKTIALITDEGGSASAMLADVSVASDIEAMIDRAVSEFGRLDILVNNAFAAPRAGGERIEDVTEAQFDAGMGLLVKAHFLATKHAAPTCAQSAVAASSTYRRCMDCWALRERWSMRPASTR